MGTGSPPPLLSSHTLAQPNSLTVQGWAERSEAYRFAFEIKTKELTFYSSMVQAQESMASAPLCAPYLAGSVAVAVSVIT
jgi:hypothetical protein